MADAAPRAFFSYARSDAAFVLKVAQTLREQGRKVWVDQLDIPKGARWDEAVESALRASRCLMVVLSPASVKSQNVMDEVAFALDEKRPVLPILLNRVAIPFRLKRLQYIDFTGDFDPAFDQLVAALDAVTVPAPEPADNEGSVGAPARTPVTPSADLDQQPPVAQPPPTQLHRPQSAAVSPVPTAAAPAAAAPAPPAPVARRFPLGWAAGITAGVLTVSYVLLTREDAPLRDVSNPDAAATAVRPTPASAAPAPPRAEAGATLVEPPPQRTEPEPVLDDARIRSFVAAYIAAQNRASAGELLAFYAARVDYFDAKGVGQDFILKDKQAYYKRWPVVENRLSSEVAVERSASDGSASVRYDIRYRVSSPARADSKSGAAREVLVLQMFQDRPLIVAQRQQVASSGAAN